MLQMKSYLTLVYFLIFNSSHLKVHLIKGNVKHAESMYLKGICIVKTVKIYASHVLDTMPMRDRFIFLRNKSPIEI